MSLHRIVGLSIPADDTQPVAVVLLEPTLPGIRQYVGRAGAEPYLEAFPLGEIVYAEHTYMWADEDGRMANLPRNARASLLAAGLVFGGDAIVGDVLVLGATDAGAEASLTVDALAWLGRALGVEVTA